MQTRYLQSYTRAHKGKSIGFEYSVSSFEHFHVILSIQKHIILPTLKTLFLSSLIVEDKL